MPVAVRRYGPGATEAAASRGNLASKSPPAVRLRNVVLGPMLPAARTRSKDSGAQLPRNITP